MVPSPLRPVGVRTSSPTILEPELHHGVIARQEPPGALAQDQVGQALRSAVAVLPDTIELGALAAEELARRGVQSLCSSSQAAERTCQAAQRAWTASRLGWQRAGQQQSERLHQWRHAHPAGDRVLSVVEGLQDIQLRTTRWTLDQMANVWGVARRSVEARLVHDLGWSSAQAETFVSNFLASATILLPGFLPRRLPSPPRLDFRNALWNHPEAFTESVLFKGHLDHDLVLVRMGRPGAGAWWTTHVEANAWATEAVWREKLALLSEFGERSHVLVARIPAGERFEALVGRAAPMRSKLTGESLAGGGLQYQFADFDPRWIREMRPLPTSTSLRTRAKVLTPAQELALEKGRVATLQASLPASALPKGVPAHLGLVRSATKTIALDVTGPGVFLKGHLPVVEVEGGAAVLIQRTTMSKAFPKAELGMGRFQNELFQSKGLTSQERAQHIVRAVSQAAQQQKWKQVTLVWDPSKYPVATAVERLGLTVEAVGDVTAAGSRNKWLRIALDQTSVGKRNRLIVAALVGAGMTGAAAGAQGAGGTRSDWESLTHWPALETLDVDSSSACLPDVDSSSACLPFWRKEHRIARPLDRSLPQRWSSTQVAEFALAIGDCLVERAQQFPGLFSARTTSVIHLLVSSHQFLQGQAHALPALMGAAGHLMGHRDLVRGSHLAGSLMSTIAYGAALNNAATPLASLVPGLGFALGVAGIIGSILSWDDEDEPSEQLQAFLQDLEEAGGDLAERVHERLQHGLHHLALSAADVLDRQESVAVLLGQSQQAARDLQAGLGQHVALLQEREAEALSQMQVTQVELVLDQQQFSQRLARLAESVHGQMGQIQQTAHQLEIRHWEQPLRNLELMEIRVPKRPLRASELASALQALRCAQAAPLPWAELLRVATACLQLRLRAHQAGLPERQLQPIVQRCAEQLRHALQQHSFAEPMRQLAAELIDLLDLPSISDEV